MRAVSNSNSTTLLAGLGLLATAIAPAACSPRRPPPQAEPSATTAPTAAPTAIPHVRSDELEPGTERAFNVLMPVLTDRVSSHDNTATFFVHQPMPRVMRYLQRRLEIISGDIHPLGAMIRHARVLTMPEGSPPEFLDISVRDESGEGTLVTFWRRMENVQRFNSADDALRAAGFDPQTGRPMAGNND